MKYRILWLDDRKRTLKKEKKDQKIIDFLDDRGFDCELIFEADYENALRKIKEYKGSFDVVFTDFNINCSETGLDFINEIRGTFKYNTEVLFYSADHSAKPKSHIDRVTFFSSYGEKHDAVLREMEKLIELTINKMLDPVYLRGQILLNFAIMEEYVKNIINKYIELKPYDENYADVFNSSLILIEEDVKAALLRPVIDDTNASPPKGKQYACTKNCTLSIPKHKKYPNNLIEAPQYGIGKKLKTIDNISSKIGFKVDKTGFKVESENYFSYCHKPIKKYRNGGAHNIEFDEEIKKNIVRVRKDLKSLNEDLNKLLEAVNKYIDSKKTES